MGRRRAEHRASWCRLVASLCRGRRHTWPRAGSVRLPFGMRIEISPVGQKPAIPAGLKDVKRARRPRRQPLMAVRNDSLGIDRSNKDSNRKLLQAHCMPHCDKALLYKQLYGEFIDFLENGPVGWAPGEECRRFSIFGDTITCSFREGEFLISGTDIVKSLTALFRLAQLGRQPADRRRFEEGIAGDLRSIKAGRGAILEEANSDLLKFLYRINSVRTHKKQKIFIWAAVPFLRLHNDSMARELRCATGGPLPCRVGGERFSPPNAHCSAYATAKDAQGPARLAHLVSIASSLTCEHSSPYSARNCYQMGGAAGSEAILFIPQALRNSSEISEGSIEIMKLADAALAFREAAEGASPSTSDDSSEGNEGEPEMALGCHRIRSLLLNNAI